MRVTLRGYLFAGLATLAFAASLPSAGITLRLAAATLVALLVVDLLFLDRRLKRVTIRVAPGACVAGRRFVERLVLSRTGTESSPFGLRVTEPASRTRSSAAAIRSLAAGERVTAELECRFRERGILTQRDFVIESPSLLGAFVMSARQTCTTDFTIEPARLSVDDALARTLDEHIEYVVSQAFERSDEFWSLRELRVGEDMRRTHALRSAAAGRLLVREHRGVENESIELVLDLRARDETMTQHARFELALRFAATFADRADDPRLRLSASLVGGTERRVFDLEQAAARRDFMRALTSASPRPVEPLPAEVLESFERRRPGVRCVLIESGVEDPALVARIGDALRPLHVSGLAPLRKPEIARAHA